MTKDNYTCKRLVSNEKIEETFFSHLLDISYFPGIHVRWQLRRLHYVTGFVRGLGFLSLRDLPQTPEARS